MSLPEDIVDYHRSQSSPSREICELLAAEIDKALPEATSMVWHAHPVWFLQDNPIVGYAVRKHDTQLLFWSGRSFDEPDLAPEGTFHAAQQRLSRPDDVDITALRRWLEKSRHIQWDYKNIRRMKGRLAPVPPFEG